MKPSPQYASRPAQEIVDGLLAMTSLEEIRGTEALATVEQAKRRDPGNSIYLSAAISDLPMFFRPVNRAEMTTIRGPLIPAGEATLEALVCAGLVYPSYERVMAECQRRGMLLTTLAEEVLRVSGSGPTYHFVRWTQ